nr:MAG TPA: hypothetical protein [Caudoviricetes sp.]
MIHSSFTFLSFGLILPLTLILVSHLRSGILYQTAYLLSKQHHSSWSQK